MFKEEASPSTVMNERSHLLKDQRTTQSSANKEPLLKHNYTATAHQTLSLIAWSTCEA
jgi:hypothetical protein